MIFMTNIYWVFTGASLCIKYFTQWILTTSYSKDGKYPLVKRETEMWSNSL